VFFRFPEMILLYLVS